MPDDDPLKEEIIDIHHDEESHNNGLRRDDIEEFWDILNNSIPKKVLGVLVPFATTYFCETGFFSLLHVETKIENHLDV